MTNVNSNKGYLTPAGGFTIECWFWRDAVPATDYATIFTQRDQSLVQWNVGGWQGRQIWFGFAPTSGAFHLNAGSTGGTGVVSWTDPSPTGYQGDSQWHHLALTLDAATMKTFTIYVDGAVYTTQTASAAITWNAGIACIAGTWFPSRSQGGMHAYDKRMAYFALFDTQLTTNRILEHYTAGNGGTVYYDDNEVERLNRIYDWAGVPENHRISDEALTQLQGIQVENNNALTKAQETAEYAGGYVFANGQASMVYHNRKRRYNRLATLIMSESMGSAPEVGLKFSTNEAFIFNDIRGERPFGSQVRLVNQASRDAHGRKVTTFKLHITDPEELKNAVSWMLARYGNDRVRISGVSFSCATSQRLRDLAYGRIDIGDMLVIDELTDPAPQSRMEFTVEGMAVSSDWLARSWMVELHLSPNELNRVFEIGASTLGGSDYLPY